jgi:hypothetical protein
MRNTPIDKKIENGISEVDINSFSEFSGAAKHVELMIDIGLIELK